MGKKRSRTKYTSKAERPNISSGTRLAARSAVPAVTKLTNKIDAWKKGLNPWLTIKNPIADPCRLNIRVRANVIYGNPKFAKSGKVDI